MPIAEGEDVDLIDGEPSAELRIACPGHMRPLWREVSELASRSSGAVLSAWQALEAVCAEALSAAPRCHFAGGPPVAIGLSEADTYNAARRYDSRDREFEVPRSFIDVNTDADLDTLGNGLADLLDAKALDDPSAEQLDQALRAVLLSMQTIDGQLGRLLARFRHLSLHRHIGYRSMGAYVTERLGICERKARSLVRLQADRAGGRGQLAAA